MTKESYDVLKAELNSLLTCQSAQLTREMFQMGRQLNRTTMIISDQAHLKFGQNYELDRTNLEKYKKIGDAKPNNHDHQ